ncbi:MAG: autotransporter assembly complex family protein, partial [Paracoccaceae bacterium]
ALALFAPAAPRALDRVDLRLSGPSNPELRQTLSDGSLLMALSGRADAAPDEIVAAARADYARLVELAYGEGYYSVAVHILIDGREAATLDPFRDPARVNKVEIEVTPGRLFRFGQARVGPLVPGTAPAEGYRNGAPARATVVREAAQSAVDDWRDAGHAKARIDGQTVLANHPQARLDSDLRLAPGPKVRFGKLVITGDSSVRPSRLRRIASLPKGEVFTPQAVDKAAARLRKTGTFKSVTLSEGETVNPDGSLDIGLNVLDRKPRRIGGGLEFSSLDGLTLSGYWLHRNLLGGAERLRLDGEIAQIGTRAKGIDYTLALRFEKPAVYGPDTLFFTEAELAYLDEPTYIERHAALTFGVSREFSDRLTGSLGLGYSFSRVTDLYTLPKTTRELRLVSLPATLTFDSRDNALDASKGLYLKGELTPFVETASKRGGARFAFDGRTYHALGGSGSVLAARLQLGALAGPPAVDAPPDYLFYSGGAGTVRGQPYKSLAADYGGVTLGGRSFAALSGEVRVPVGEKWGVVGFADAGFVGDGTGNGDWHAGAGLGVRYKTPVGPIRLDIAGPVAGKTGSGLQLYIGIGQAF